MLACGFSGYYIIHVLIKTLFVHRNVKLILDCLRRILFSFKYFYLVFRRTISFQTIGNNLDFPIIYIFFSLKKSLHLNHWNICLALSSILKSTFQCRIKVLWAILSYIKSKAVFFVVEIINFNRIFACMFPSQFKKCIMPNLKWQTLWTKTNISPKRIWKFNSMQNDRMITFHTFSHIYIITF